MSIIAARRGQISSLVRCLRSRVSASYTMIAQVDERFGRGDKFNTGCPHRAPHHEYKFAARVCPPMSDPARHRELRRAGMSRVSESLSSPPILSALAIEVEEAGFVWRRFYSLSAMLLFLGERLGCGVAEDTRLLLRGRRTAWKRHSEGYFSYMLAVRNILRLLRYYPRSGCKAAKAENKSDSKPPPATRPRLRRDLHLQEP
jgi:hypothetical protein